MPCTYQFSKITENPVSILRHHCRRHIILCLPPHAACDVCSPSVWASARPSAGPKCCAHVLSVPGAVVASASAGKGCRGYQVHLFSPAIVGLNFQTKGRSKLYFLQWVLPLLIVLERPSRMYLHILLWISINPVCIYVGDKSVCLCVCSQLILTGRFFQYCPFWKAEGSLLWAHWCFGGPTFRLSTCSIYAVEPCSTISTALCWSSL